MSKWFGAKLIVTKAGLLCALAESLIILSLIFNTSLRLLTIAVFNRLKHHHPKSPLIIKIIQIILFAFFLFNIYSIILYFSLPAAPAADQLLLVVENSLIASITGILLFLSLVIEKLHSLILEGLSLENTTNAEENVLRQRKRHHKEQLIEHEFMLKRLKATNRKLEFEFQMKMNEAEAVKARLEVLKSEAEGFQAGYDRLLEYNQILKNQLHSIDQRMLQDNQETGWANLKSNLLSWGSGSSTKSRDEGLCENEVNATDRYDQLLCSNSPGKSSPRHRRPIYQF